MVRSGRGQVRGKRVGIKPWDPKARGSGVLILKGRRQMSQLKERGSVCLSSVFFVYQSSQHFG
jgi:hypothetical protein